MVNSDIDSQSPIQSYAMSQVCEAIGIDPFIEGDYPDNLAMTLLSGFKATHRKKRGSNFRRACRKNKSPPIFLA